MTKNGAGFDPNIEDVPGDLGEEEICLKCGGELVEKLIGDELIMVCIDCDLV